MDQSITAKVIGAAIEVHRHLGPGLLEFTYELCLAREFDLRNIKYQKQMPCSLIYKDLAVDGACRIDFLIEDEVVLEIKSVETFSDIHTSQLLTYLHLLRLRRGLLLNFNVPMLKNGIKRISL
jgi:GxxExxY protein